MPQYLHPGVYVEEIPPLARPIAGAGTSTPGFIGVIPDTVQLAAKTRASDAASDIARGYKFVDFSYADPVRRAQAGRAYFITSWTQYTQLFGDFIGDDSAAATSAASPAVDTGQRHLAHAVFGFFNNGGTGCYVARVAAAADLGNALRAFAAITDITMVAAPGLTGGTNYAALTSHCETLQDRVAILDPVETNAAFDTGDFTLLQNPTTATPTPGLRPQDSSFAAFYFPWIQVFDPATALMTAKNSPPGDGLIYVPPSGHMAGIYARTDATRGVHKAPANEGVLGATGLRYALSNADQDMLNDNGVNLIRSLNGAIRVWGARTVGGDANGDFKYISTRRFFNFLRTSIDQGTQFVVFEPNSPALWQRIIRSVSDFLLLQWRAGALFGDTPAKAFFVKCDKDTNPPEVRDAGQVVTEIGVAIVKPAEFVIFRIQQVTGG
ncbi:MAG TPA: phage tail sheath C-terminal domain-containing protein [Bryobacteraceae bacterium]|nr:phage tail sheath C-terminal domain-containing protein [Bryobacteraceae bacterium]